MRWLSVSMNFFRWAAASRALRCVFSIGVIATAKKIPACLMSAARLPAGQPGNTSGDQGLLVELGQVQRLQAGGQRLAAQALRRLQARLPALLQVRSQRGLITSRQIEKLAFHAFLNSRAARRTDLADFTTSRCVLAISFLRPLVLVRASCFKESSRTLMPSKVWAISS